MRVVWIVLLALALGAGIYWYAGQQGASGGGPPPSVPTPVTAWAVAEQPFQRRVEALGTLRAWESVTITASVAETVAAVHFNDGQRVREGDLLVTLQQVEEQAALQEQQEFLKEQLREVRRLESLVKSNQVAQTELDQRRTLAAIARSRIEQRKAEINDRTIAAPFDGILGLRQVSPGALVEPGQVITTLDDVSRMKLDFTVPARFLRFLEPGQQIEANTAAYPQAFSGSVSAVDSRVDPVNRSITARGVFDNGNGLLKPGMLMQVTVLGDTRQAMMVPEESLLSQADEHFVWQIEGETAKRVPVEIGDRRPGWVEIQSGLKPADVIVRDGVGKLRGMASAVRVLEN